MRKLMMCHFIHARRSKSAGLFFWSFQSGPSRSMQREASMVDDVSARSAAHHQHSSEMGWMGRGMGGQWGGGWDPQIEGSQELPNVVTHVSTTELLLQERELGGDGCNEADVAASQRVMWHVPRQHAWRTVCATAWAHTRRWSFRLDCCSLGEGSIHASCAPPQKNKKIK